MLCFNLPKMFQDAAISLSNFLRSSSSNECAKLNRCVRQLDGHMPTDRVQQQRSSLSNYYLSNSETEYEAQFAYYSC